MRFCYSCGTYLRETEQGLWCAKCNKLTHSKPRIRTKQLKKHDSAVIQVVDKSKENLPIVTRICPECGNDDAFHWFSRVTGEHAGVRQERTVEHFKCVECHHLWSESS